MTTSTSVGDQVQTLVSNLERDHITALSHIDELTTANDSFRSTVTLLEKQLADRGDALSTAEKQLADATAMVETVANAALAMLKTVRGVAPTIATAQVTPPLVLVASNAAPLVPAAPVTGLAGNDPIAGDLVVAINAATDSRWRNADGSLPIMAGDSGDEQPAAAPMHIMEGRDVGAPMPPATATTLPPITFAAEVAKIEAKIAEVPAAVERMLHHSSGGAATIRRPVDMTTHVDHDNEGLPIFLRRGTAFEAMTNRDRT